MVDGWPCPGSIPGAGHLFRYVTNQPPKANSAVHPSGVGKWVPASAGKAKAGMVHSVSGWTWGVQVKLWDPLRMRAIPECLRGVFTTRCYTNPRLPYLTLPYLWSILWHFPSGCLASCIRIGLQQQRLISVKNNEHAAVWCMLVNGRYKSSCTEYSVQIHIRPNSVFFSC